MKIYVPNYTPGQHFWIGIGNLILCIFAMTLGWPGFTIGITGFLAGANITIFVLDHDRRTQ